MTYNTRQSITDIVSGLQPNNKFLVKLMTLPYGFAPTMLKSYTITSVNIPGVSIGKVPIYEMGKEYNIAGRTTYNDWEVTIRTWQYDDLRLFKRWVSQTELPIEHKIDGQRVIDKGRASSYKSQCELTMLDNESKKSNDTGPIQFEQPNTFEKMINNFTGGSFGIQKPKPKPETNGDAEVQEQATIILDGVFPIAISDIQYSEGEMEFVEFNVTFNIDSWYFKNSSIDYSVTRDIVNHASAYTDNSNAFLSNVFEKAKSQVTSNFYVDKALNLSNTIF